MPKSDRIALVSLAALVVAEIIYLLWPRTSAKVQLPEPTEDSSTVVNAPAVVDLSYDETPAIGDSDAATKQEPLIDRPTPAAPRAVTSRLDQQLVNVF